MRRRRSFIGPLILIGLGLLLLYSTLRANWGPWEAIWRYWPILLIAWGLGKLWDHMRHRESAPGTAGPRFTGGEVGLAVALVVLVGLAFAHKSKPEPVGHYHYTQTVTLQGAKTVHARVELGAGELAVSGGAPNLMEADCFYNRPSLKPEVSYDVTGSDGSLEIRQPETHQIHWGRSNRSDWTLRFSNQVPLDLSIKFGAGTGRLRLAGMQLSHLSIEGGVGTATVDLGGDWKQSFDGRISGGVGTVTLRLPRNVGVNVRATGGLGSVNAPGFEREGDVYVNSAYGKSPVTITLDVEGGIGTINLEPAS
jgi:hypothetical protein